MIGRGSDNLGTKASVNGPSLLFPFSVDDLANCLSFSVVHPSLKHLNDFRSLQRTRDRIPKELLRFEPREFLLTGEQDAILKGVEDVTVEESGET